MAYVRKSVVFETLKMIRDTDIFPDHAIAFLNQLANREELQIDFFIVAEHLLNVCNQYNQEKDKLLPYQDYLAQQKITSVFEGLRANCYRQKRILIFVTNRKQILDISVGPVNLGGFITPQALRVESDQSYGLGYAEARNYAIEKAINSRVYTHLLMLDNDVLIPHNGLQYLCDLNLPIVAMNYYKKNTLTLIEKDGSESNGDGTCTELLPDSKDIYQNHVISGEDPKDLAPRFCNCLHMGCTLIDLDCIKRLNLPPGEKLFKFCYDILPDGTQGRVILGEDSYFIKLCLQNNVKSYVVPGLMALHCDLQTGKYYGPRWAVNEKNEIRPNVKDKFTHFLVDPKQLYVPYDNCDVFGKGPQKQAYDERLNGKKTL